ncbi:CaiB/BaiF CoA transferase family protein [Sneathiella aquimaris]|uniref:CaiB/BaiF CoA transferase family protein n=1 Tax=Sneathiella aquimaris TaxID=2599305 RepID=UPI00146C61B2|nr:CoA transferase [Sneathiella aquimaris]
MKPLDGVKVIDLSNMLMAPYATQILGDLGADVIKVEPPTGDPVRGITPYRHQGMGAIYLNCNRSKRSVVLDLKTQDGYDILIEMLKDADVLVYNRRPQVMARLNLSYETVKKINPRLIYAGLFGYGQGGTYEKKPAFDDLIQGAVSIPWLQHMADGREPTYAPTAIVDRGVGLWAVGQINAALFHQLKTGRGQQIDLPMFEMMTSFVLSDHLAGKTFEPPIGEVGYKRMMSPDRRPYQTLDGYVCVMVYTDRHWASFYKALGREDDLIKDPRLKNMSTRTENISAILKELADLLKTRTTADWLALFDQADIPAMPLHTPDSLLQDPHLKDVDFFYNVEHPTEGQLLDMRVPAHWSETQPAPTRHAPQLGEHSREVLSELGYSPERIKTFEKAGVTNTL